MARQINFVQDFSYFYAGCACTIICFSYVCLQDQRNNKNWKATKKWLFQPTWWNFGSLTKVLLQLNEFLGLAHLLYFCRITIVQLKVENFHLGCFHFGWYCQRCSVNIFNASSFFLMSGSCHLYKASNDKFSVCFDFFDFLSRLENQIWK